MAEVGAVGLALLVGFFLLVLGAAVRLVVRSDHEAGARAAGAAAALLAFMVSAAVDWVWQLPVLPAAFLLLAAAVLAPAPRPASVRQLVIASPPGEAGTGARRRRLPVCVATALIAIVCLFAIGVPLTTVTAVRNSQAAVVAGDTTSALVNARSAARLEPGFVSAQLQLVSVRGLKHEFSAAPGAARATTRDEPQTWLAALSGMTDNLRPTLS